MRQRAVRLWLTVVSILVLSSCAIIPVDYYTGYSRKNTGETTPESIKIGTSSREDVIMTLGEPDEASADETELRYRATKVKAIIIAGYQGAAVTREYILVVRLDARGIVESQRIEESAELRR